MSPIKFCLISDRRVHIDRELSRPLTWWI